MKFALLALVVFSVSAFAKEARKPSAVPDYSKLTSDIDCTSSGGTLSGTSCVGGKYDGFKVGTCSYQLDGVAYVRKDDGDLQFEGKKFRCTTYLIGESDRDLCKRVGSTSKNFDLVVGFDGAENDFFVSNDLDSDRSLCHAVATEKKRH